MPRTYPYGYQGTRLTLDQLQARATVSRLHPEFWRRTLAMMDAAQDEGVDLGIGTGWRVQPDPPPPGFAKPGNSNHEGFPVGPTSTGAVAADMVPAEAWPWMDDNAHRFGLKTFTDVNDEPWHIQPAEIPNSRTYRPDEGPPYPGQTAKPLPNKPRTIPWDLARFPLPGDTPALPPDEEDEDMTFVGIRSPGPGAALISHGGAGVTFSWLRGPDVEQFTAKGVEVVVLDANTFDELQGQAAAGQPVRVVAPAQGDTDAPFAVALV